MAGMEPIAVRLSEFGGFEPHRGGMFVANRVATPFEPRRGGILLFKMLAFS